MAKSRRFPAVTQDTARPEGAGRAIPGAVSTPARQWPMLSVLAATAVGLLTTAMGHPRVGCLVIGVALIGAAVLRRALPSVGMLAVRSRFTDMVTYGVLGVAITLLALVMEPKPVAAPAVPGDRGPLHRPLTGRPPRPPGSRAARRGVPGPSKGPGEGGSPGWSTGRGWARTFEPWGHVPWTTGSGGLGTPRVG